MTVSRVRLTVAATAAAGAVTVLSGCGLLNSVLGGNVMEISVGDCFVISEMNAQLQSGEVSDVPLVECSEEHDGEFFHSHEVSGDSYPGDAAVGDEAEEVCSGSAFSDFVGVDYMSSEIYVGYLTPTEQTWDQLDDREILCYLETADMVSGSQEGAAV